MESTPSRRELSIEVLVVFGTYLLPFLGTTIYSLTNTAGELERSWGAMMPFEVFQVIPQIILLGYIMRSRGIKAAQIGLGKINLFLCLWLSFAAFILMYLCLCLAYWVSAPSVSAADMVRTEMFDIQPGSSILIIVASLISTLGYAFLEELVCRGYAITRLTQIGWSSAWAIIVPGLLFGSYHIYQGAYGALNATLMGLAMGYFFFKTRQLWPIFIAHAAYNLWAMGYFGR